MKKAIIVDIDGCMLDDREILKYIPENIEDREAWKVFHKNLWKCKPIGYMFDIVNNYKHTVIFMTAREHLQSVRQMTHNSLCGVEKNYMLLMRPVHDLRDSDVVKKDLYNNYIKDNYIVEYAIDDNQENINMYQSLGIPTLQHRYGA
jgi:hypothetical protein